MGEHPDSGQRTTEVAATFRENYAVYQYAIVDFFADHLVDVCRTFKGDMHMAVILAVIGQSMLQQALDGKKWSGAEPKVVAERAGIATSRIADATGIPRETVRRKLASLERLGWIVRNDAGWSIAYDRDGPGRPWPSWMNDRFTVRLDSTCRSSACAENERSGRHTSLTPLRPNTSTSTRCVHHKR